MPGSVSSVRRMLICSSVLKLRHGDCDCRCPQAVNYYARNDPILLVNRRAATLMSKLMNQTNDGEVGHFASSPLPSVQR